MAKTKISEWSTTPSSNTDIDGINIAEGCAPSGINDAIRDLMAQVRSWQSGASGDPFNGPMNGTIGSTTAYAGAFTTLSASSTVTLSGGTANGIAYLNGSKVVTSGSALWFDGTNFGVGTGGNTLNHQSVVYKVGANAVYQQIANGSTGLGATNGIRVGLSSAGVGEWYSPTAAISYIDNSEQMRLTFTGLGIGTSSPSSKLHLKSTTGTAETLITLQTAFSNPSGNKSIVWADNSNTLGAIAVKYSSPQASMVFGSLYNSGYNTTDLMTLDGAGNLGLGVTPKAWVSGAKALQSGGFLAAWTQQNGAVNLGFAAYEGSSNVFNYMSTGDAPTLYSQLSGAHRWYTAPSGTAGNAITFSQAMTLDASGNLLVGTTSQFQSSKLSVSGSGNVGDFRTSSASGYPVVCENTASGSTNMVIFLTGASTTTVGSITYNGSLTLYNTTSDQRLKENIQDSDSASNLIDSLKVRKFDWKESNVHQRYGFVAQELVTVAPEAVHQPADTNEMMAVDYSKLVPMLVKEIQSLRKRLADAGI